MATSVSEVERTARYELGITDSVKSDVFLRKFTAMLGTKPNVVCCMWNMLIVQNKLPDGVIIKHLLWALSLLKIYGTDYFYSIFYEVHPDTFRKWSWKVICALETLELVRNFL
jgi:hypothetical protein